MRDVLADIDRWQRAGSRVALARVVDVEGSGPRGPGAAMAVSADGEVAGSVSGGCVEGAVVGESLAVLAGDAAARIVTFGYSDDEALSVGLTCGGTVHVFIDELRRDGVVDALTERLRRSDPVAVATVVSASDSPGIEWSVPAVGTHVVVTPDGAVAGSLGDDDLDRVVIRDTMAELEAARSGMRHYGPHGETTPEDLEGSPVIRVFVESHAPPPRMWIFGAVDFTAALARVAKVLGYRVTVIDAREVFATRRRFPMADEIVVSWPTALFDERGVTLGSRDAVCILTHDPKFDEPAIAGALATDVGYIGVMGSRTTHARRLERLAAAGLADPTQVARLMSPIGLDLGARTPEETAISICAEIIARRTGHGVPSLRDADGPIHGEFRPAAAP